MQDNYQHEFDEQFIGQAWQEMRRLLDKEMPVRHKRRPAWWLWLSGGFLLLALLAGSAYFLFRPAPMAPAVAPRPIAGQERGVDKSRDKKTPESGLSTESEAFSSRDENLPPRARNGGNELQGIPARRAQALLYAAPVLQKSDNILTGAREEKKTQQGSLAAENPGPTTLSDQRLPAPAFLKNQRAPLLPYAGGENFSVSSTPLRKRPAALRLALEGSAFFSALSFPDGYGGGLALEARPHSSRIYWRSGAFFRTFNQNLKTEENRLRLENSAIKIPQADGSLANSTSTLLAHTAISRTQYIQLPLTAGFQWKPRLAVEAGLQFGILASAVGQSSWSLKNEENLSPGGPQPGNNTLYRFDKGPASQSLNHTALDLIAGLAYRPSAHTSIRLYYQYGLSDILAGPGQKAYMRGLQLSVAYYPAL